MKIHVLTCLAAASITLATKVADAATCGGESAPHECTDEEKAAEDAAWTSFVGGTLEVAGAVLAAPFVLPWAIFEHNGPHPSQGWSIMPSPYDGGAPGYFEPVAEPAGSPAFAVPLAGKRSVAFRLALEGMAPLDGPARASLRAQLLTVDRLDLDVSYGVYFDRQDGFPSAKTGSAHLAFQLARSAHVLFRLGVGARQWSDSVGADFGFDAVYGVDLFPIRPVTISFEVSGGSLGNGGAVEPRATIGYVLGRGEIYAGYDAAWIIRVGPRPTAYLGGLIAGVRGYL